MNPKSIPKRLSSWVLLCFASFFLAVTAFGQATIQNNTPITIRDENTAEPYPSTITVSNFVGGVKRIVVNINKISHNYPDDIDILLVGPANQQILLMSDAGGQFDVSGLDLSFDSSASAGLPDETQVAPGAYLPSNFDPADTIPGVATNLTSTSGFGPLIGSDANGAWRLYVVDDQIVDAGSIGSWSITFYMTPVLTLSTTSTNTIEDVSVDIPLTVADTDTLPEFLVFSASFDTNYVQRVDFFGVGTSRTARIVPALNANTDGGGPTVVGIRVSDGLHTNEISVNLVINGRNDPPTIALSTNAVTIPLAGISGDVSINLNDPDNSTNILVLTAASSNPAIVSATNVYFTRTPSNITARVASTGTSTGPVNITISAIDPTTVPNGPLTNSVVLTVTVTNINRFVQANSAPIVPPDGGAIGSTNTVSASVRGEIRDVEVVLLDLEHPNPGELSFNLVGPGGINVLLAAGQGGATAISNTWLKFDDEAAGPLGTPVVSGTYRAVGNLSSFDGANPNGDWILFVSESSAGGTTGAVYGGWILSLSLAPTIDTATNTFTTVEDKEASFPILIGDRDGNPSTVTVIATNHNTSLFTAAISGTGTNRTLTITPVANQFGSSTVDIIAQDQDGFGELLQVTVVITAVNDAPQMSPIPKIVTFVGVPVSTNIMVTDIDNDPNSLILTASTDSNGAKVLPAGSIYFDGTGTNRTMIIFPGIASGTAIVTVRVTDSQAANNFTERTFEFTALPAGVRAQANTARIDINDPSIINTSSNATPFPSPISISAGTFNGLISDIEVTLFNVTHPAPQHLDILLHGPTGTNILLMSDVGGTNGITNQTLVFRSSGSPIFTIPQGQLHSGFYAPTTADPNGDLNEDTTAEFGNVTGFRTTTLDTYAGSSPNGTWNLYVRDDTVGPRGGVIEGGWLLNIRTRPKIDTVALPATVTTQEDVALNLPKVRFADDPQTGEYEVFTINNASAFANVVATNEAGFLNITILPLADAFGTNTVQIIVSNNVSHDVDPRTFTLRVQSVEDQPRFSDLNTNTSYSTLAAVPITITFFVSDPETAASALQVSATSLTAALVPNSNISIVNNGGLVTLRLVSQGTDTGDAKIRLVVKDGANLETERTITIRIDPNRQGFSNANPITIPPQGEAPPSFIDVPVGGVVGQITNINVILDGFTHRFPDDVDALLVHPNGANRIMLISDAGGSNAVNNLRLAFQDLGNVLPDSDPLTSGTYWPGNFSDVNEATETLAGFSTFSTNLTSLYGLNPQGRWTLYVRDDTFPDGGSLTNWIILFQTAPMVSGIASTQRFNEDDVYTVEFDVIDGDTPSANLVLSAVVDTSATGITNGLLVNSNISFTVTDQRGRLTIRPTTNLWGESAIRLTVADNTNNAFTTNINLRIVVNPTNDAPSISVTNALIVINEQQSVTNRFFVADVDNILRSTNLVVVSSNTGLVPNAVANISIVAGGGSTNGSGFIDVVITPAADRPRTAESEETVLTATIRDFSTVLQTNLTAKVELTIRVLQVNDAPVFKAPLIPGVVNVEVNAASPTIPFGVDDIETPARDLIVAAINSSNPLLLPTNNVVIGFGSSGDVRTLQVVPVGDQPGQATITLVVQDLGANGDPTIRQVVTNFVVNVTPLQGTLVANTNRIAIPDSGAAALYPSVINIGGTVGPVNQVYVTLEGVTHTNPDDLDIVLQSPSGRAVVLMSDAGGTADINNVRIQISDSLFNSAARSLPDEGTILGGTNVYQASNYRGSGEVTETLPGTATPPVPAVPADSALADFRGEASANGAWRLFVADDTAANSGEIANGWALRIVTSPNVQYLAGSSVTNVDEDFPIIIALDIADGTESNLPNLSVTYESGDGVLFPITNNITTNWSGSTLTVTVQPATNQFNTNTTFTVIVARGNAATRTTVTARVRPVDDAPTVSRLSPATTQQDTPIWVPVQVTDPEIDLGQGATLAGLRLDAFSDSQTLVTNSNLRFTLADGSNTGSNPVSGLTTNIYWLRIQPNPSAIGSNITIFVVARQIQGNTNLATTNFFTLDIADRNDLPTIAVAPASTNVVAGSGGSGVFTVTDADPTDNITFGSAATSSDQTVIRNQDITISGSGRSRTVSFITQPGSGTPEGRSVQIRLTATDNRSNPIEGTLNVVVFRSREQVFPPSETNNGLITIQDNPVNGGRANPYPSPIRISESDLAGPISKLAVILDGFEHTFPSDVDVMLVGPTGERVILMSDAGGNARVTNLVLRFEQGFPAIPNSQLSSGTFSPANYDGTTDPFPDALGSGTPGTDLSVFNNDSPIGDWYLYVMDDTASDSGRIIRGWRLAITTRPVADVTPAAQTIAEDTTGRATLTVTDEAFITAPLSGIRFTSTNTTLLPVANIAVTGGSGRTREISFTPATNQVGQTLVTVFVTSGGIETSDTFSVTVTNVNDAPEIVATVPGTDIRIDRSFSTNVTAGNWIAIPFIIRDVETDSKVLLETMEISSSDPVVIPTNYVRLDGTNLYIFNDASAITTEARRSDINIAIRDEAGEEARIEFRITVQPSSAVTLVNGTLITIPESGSSSESPSPIVVPSSVLGSTRRVVVTLREVTHRFPDDLDIMLVGPDNSRVILMSDAGSGNSTNAALDRAWFSFADSASDSLPDNTPITNKFATYKPTNHEGTGSDFVVPTTVSTTGALSTLGAAFNNKSPVGTWRLYVSDDAAPDAGSIGGWQLRIETSAPTIEFISNATIQEEAIGEVQFIVGGDNLAANAITYNTNDLRFIRVLSITPATAGTNTFRFEGLPNAFGTDTVTITVKDPTGVTVQRSFTVTVTPVNDAPIIVGLMDTNTPANIALSVPFIVTDIESGSAGLTVTVSNSNPDLATALINGADGSYTLVVVPQGIVTNVTLTVTASDGTASTALPINVTIVESLGPTLSEIADLTVSEKQGVPPIAFVFTTPDSANTTLIATASDTNLVQDLGVTGIGTNRSLLVILRENGLGTNESLTTTITLRAQNEFGTATESFSLTVTNVPDAPTLAPIPDRSVAEDSLVEIVLNVTDPDTALADLIFSFTTTNPQIVQNVEFPAGTPRIARIILGRDQTGPAVVSITVRDPQGGTATRSFALNVTEVDDAPVLGPIADAQVLEDAPVAINLSVTDESPLNALTYTGSSSDSNLVSGITFTTTGTTAVANIALVTNRFGTATITISVAEGTNVSSQSFELTVIEEIELPVLGAIADIATNENSIITIPLTVSDRDDALTNLTFFYATTNGTALVQDLSFAFSSSNTVAAVITLRPNTGGAERVTISVSDGNAVSRQSFNLAVSIINDPPRVSEIADVTTASTNVVINFTVTDELAASALTYFWANTSNLVSNVQFTATSATTVSATVTLVAGRTGTDRLTFSVSDGESTARRSFNITVSTDAPAPVLTVTRSGSNLVLGLSGNAGSTVVVEGTSDFVTWTQISTVTLGTNGQGQVEVPITGHHRFFRARNQ